jgi:hypothetical protein
MTTKHEHDNPILVTGAAGAVGGIGRSHYGCGYVGAPMIVG